MGEKIKRIGIKGKRRRKGTGRGGKLKERKNLKEGKEKKLEEEEKNEKKKSKKTRKKIKILTNKHLNNKLPIQRRINQDKERCKET